MVTIKHVARKAKVAASTVSAVINSSAPVSEKTRARVIAAMKALDYHPSKIAQSLRTRKTYTIGVLVRDITNPFFPEVVRGIEEVARANDYHIILCDAANDPQEAHSSLRNLLRAKIDAVVLIGRIFESPPSAFSLFENQKIPVVSVERNYDVPWVHNILADVFSGAYEAVKHLSDNGYQRVAFICPQLALEQSRRFKGYQTALQENGIGVEGSMVRQTSATFEGGLQATRLLLEQKNSPQGIFAYNDLMAIGALFAIREKGLKVPDDIAVVGFDDIQAAAFTSPPLSTVALPKHQLGTLAMKTALQLIKRNDAPQIAIVQTSLVIRASSGHNVRKQGTEYRRSEQVAIASEITLCQDNGQ